MARPLVCLALALIVDMGSTVPGVVRRAAAGSLQIGAGSTVQLGNALLALGCNDLHIQPAGTLAAQASTITLAGNWDNRGMFDPGTGTVRLEDGCAMPEMSTIGGSNSFFDLVVTTSAAKTVKFQAGATQTILDQLILTGAPGNLLMVRSTVPGQQAFVDLAPTGSQQIDYVDVADNAASGQLLAPGSPALHQSINSGNNTGWFFMVQAAPVASGLGLVVMVVILLGVGGRALRRGRRWPTSTGVCE